MFREIFTRNYNLLFAGNLLLCIAFYMIIAVFPPYAVNDLKIDTSDVGLVIGVFSVSAVMIRPFLGKAVDKYNRLVVFLPALVLFVICCFLYSEVTSMTGVIITRLLHGIAWSGMTTAYMTIVTDIVPMRYRGRGIGYAGLSMTIAMAIGPAIGLYLLEFMDYHQFFLTCTGLSACALVTALMLRLPKVEKITPAEQEKKGALFEKKVLGITFAFLMTGFSYASIVTYIVLHAETLGITQTGLFFLILGLAVGFSRPITGKVMDTRSPTVLLVVGITGNIICSLMLAFTDTTSMFLLAGFFGGLSTGILFPTYSTMGMNSVPPHRRGASNATLFSGMDVGIASGSIIHGMVANKFGFPSIYMLAAIAMLLPLVWYFTKGRKQYEELSSLYKK